MGLDLTIDDKGTITVGVLQLAVYVIIIVIALVFVERFVPRLLKGICRATVILGGIYLFARWMQLRALMSFLCHLYMSTPITFCLATRRFL